MLEELKSLKTWVVHKEKEPFSALTGKPTGVDDKHSEEWGTYDEAKKGLEGSHAGCAGRNAGLNDDLAGSAGVTHNGMANLHRHPANGKPPRRAYRL